MKKELLYFIAEKGDEKHVIRYYDNDLVAVAEKLQEIANSKEFKFDRIDLINSIFRLCKQHMK